MKTEPNASALLRLRRTWETLGREDALWAIATLRGKRGNRWSLDEFMATGMQGITDLMAYVSSLGVALARESALEFGCGAGRLTQALALHFKSVWGVDISEPMLQLARQNNRWPDRCHYTLNARADLNRFSDGSFDFVYSEITLQHIPRPLAGRYISELARVTSPGGLLVFGVVHRSWQWEPRAVARRLLPEPVARGVRWMIRRGRPWPALYGTSRAEVARAVMAGGGRIINSLRLTNYNGWSYVRYAVVKRGSDT